MTTHTRCERRYACDPAMRRYTVAGCARADGAAASAARAGTAPAGRAGTGTQAARRRPRGDPRPAGRGARNGYGIMQEIEQRSAGAWRPSPGSVYPVLAQLEDEGLVEPDEGGERKLVRLTDEGREYVAERREAPRDAVGDRGRRGQRGDGRAAHADLAGRRGRARGGRQRDARAARAGPRRARRDPARALPDPRGRRTRRRRSRLPTVAAQRRTRRALPRLAAGGGHYESFYLKASHPSEPVASVDPLHGAQAPRTRARRLALVHALRRADGPRAVKQTLRRPGRRAATSTSASATRRSRDGAVGERRKGRGAPRRWDLTFDSAGRAAPPPAARLAVQGARSRAPSCSARTRTPASAAAPRSTAASVELDGWRGMVGHNWGAEHAERWIWMHGAGFEGRRARPGSTPASGGSRSAR